MSDEPIKASTQIHTSLQRSQYLSWFQQRGVLYLYHDLSGDLIEMSPDLRDLLSRFKTPQRRSEMTTPGSEIDGFIDTFIEHDCLVSEGSDEHALLSQRYPLRGPWICTLLREDGRWEAVVGRNVQTSPRHLVFSHWESALWRHFDGQKTLAQIVDILVETHKESPAETVFSLPQNPLSSAVKILAAWTHSETQLARVDRLPASFYTRSDTPRPPHLRSTMPFERLPEDEGASGLPASAVIDLREYHQHTINDADQQFDDVETTLSHLFRIPHEALQGRTYATRLLDVLIERQMVHSKTKDLAEVGGGVGFFAAQLVGALKEEHPNIYANTTYRIFDVSPTLHASQKRKLAPFFPNAQALMGDAADLSWAPESLDIVLSNEVIGDLLTAPVTWGAPASLEEHVDSEAPRDEKEDPQEEPPWFDPQMEGFEEEEEAYELGGESVSVALLLKYDVPLFDAPPRFFFNLGAVRLIEQIWTALRPAGHAVLTEFGDLWQYPIESTHLDHAEFSIHFGQLLHIARKIGFEAEVEDVFDMLKFDGNVQTMTCTRTHFRNLSTLFAARNITLEKIAYSPQMLAEITQGTISIEDIETLEFEPLEERVMGLVPREFKALILHKPLGI